MNKSVSLSHVNYYLATYVGIRRIALVIVLMSLCTGAESIKSFIAGDLKTRRQTSEGSIEKRGEQQMNFLRYAGNEPGSL